ncbi:mucin-2-like [Pelobates fuscus]|uniref:mucin-2-like n=1 Tax=Pelobates fuscus TaxID=191477 RepID=UPI002FE4413F
MKILLVGLCLGICATTCLAQIAKTCNDCNVTRVICDERPGYVSCSCKDGYIGNGLNCTRILSCKDSQCCSKGYTWDKEKKTCVDIDECADASLNKCSPPATCINKKGIFLCLNKRDSLCPSDVCPNDLDCLTVNGNIQCADPCENYQELDGETRLSTIQSTGRFRNDRYNIGWFRFTGRAGLSLIEGCVGPLKCGSLEPFSLDGPHPAMGEGVKMVPLIINAMIGCLPGSSIPVKACPGRFYVYKLTGSIKLDVYCTDPVIKMPSTTTTIPPTTVTTTVPSSITTVSANTMPTTDKAIATTTIPTTAKVVSTTTVPATTKNTVTPTAPATTKNTVTPAAPATTTIVPDIQEVATTVLPTTTSAVDTTTTVLPPTTSVVDTATTVLPTTTSAVDTTTTVLPTTPSIVDTTTTGLPTSTSAVDTTTTVLPSTTSATDTSPTVLPTTTNVPDATPTNLPTTTSVPDVSPSVLPITTSVTDATSTVLPTTISIMGTSVSDAIINVLDITISEPKNVSSVTTTVQYANTSMPVNTAAVLETNPTDQAVTSSVIVALDESEITALSNNAVENLAKMPTDLPIILTDTKSTSSEGSGEGSGDEDFLSFINTVEVESEIAVLSDNTSENVSKEPTLLPIMPTVTKSTSSEGSGEGSGDEDFLRFINTVADESEITVLSDTSVNLSNEPTDLPIVRTDTKSTSVEGSGEGSGDEDILHFINTVADESEITVLSDTIVNLSKEPTVLPIMLTSTKSTSSEGSGEGSGDEDFLRFINTVADESEITVLSDTIVNLSKEPTVLPIMPTDTKSTSSEGSGEGSGDEDFLRFINTVADESEITVLSDTSVNLSKEPTVLPIMTTDTKSTSSEGSGDEDFLRFINTVADESEITVLSDTIVNLSKEPTVLPIMPTDTKSTSSEGSGEGSGDEDFLRFINTVVDESEITVLSDTIVNLSKEPTVLPIMPTDTKSTSSEESGEGSGDEDFLRFINTVADESEITVLSDTSVNLSKEPTVLPIMPTDTKSTSSEESGEGSGDEDFLRFINTVADESEITVLSDTSVNLSKEPTVLTIMPTSTKSTSSEGSGEGSGDEDFLRFINTVADESEITVLSDTIVNLSKEPTVLTIMPTSTKSTSSEGSGEGLGDEDFLRFINTVEDESEITVLSDTIVNSSKEPTVLPMMPTDTKSTSSEESGEGSDNKSTSSEGSGNEDNTFIHLLQSEFDIHNISPDEPDSTIESFAQEATDHTSNPADVNSTSSERLGDDNFLCFISMNDAYSNIASDESDVTILADKVTEMLSKASTDLPLIPAAVTGSVAEDDSFLAELNTNHTIT